jgi:hypothetical protein
MYTTLFPYAKLNMKTAILVPMLILSMFTFVPAVQTQVMPGIAKITPAVFEQMSSAGESINVIIETLSNDYSALVSQINDLGGKISQMFKYVNALSASVPKSQLVELSANSHVQKIYFDAQRELTVDEGADMDLMRNAPTVAEADGVEAIELTPEMLSSIGPENAWNSIAMGAQPIWTTTNYGAGSLVAIIDSGLWTGHIFFAYTSIIGGVDVSADVGDPTYEGWDNINNFFHGGHVAGILAANIALSVSPTSSLNRYVLAIERYAGVTFPVVGGRKVMPVPGMAPLASLYIIKVFDHTGGAVSTSTIMAGMEHALDLKVSGGVDVDIVNMSLGGANLFDGRDPEDQLVDMMTSAGITVATSAGNEGPATMTAGSRPGSANTAIASGAADHPVQVRAFWDYAYNWPGLGYLAYASDNIQIDTMTSRGPIADGRVKPTITANGVYVFSAYTTGGQYVAWASGTSMASPGTAGAIALLNAYAEMNGLAASPEDYKQAVTGGAIWLPGWTQYDQGAGYLNAANALAVLMADTSLGDIAPPLDKDPKLVDIRNIPIVTNGIYTTSVSNLAPGWNEEFIFQATEATDSIRVEVTNVDIGANNPLGENSIEVYIASAKRTRADYFIESANVIGDSWFYITDDETTYGGDFLPGTTIYSASHVIEPGYVKVVIENVWTGYDVVSADIKIEVTKVKKTPATITMSGQLWPGQAIGWIGVNIPTGTTKAIVELWWVHDWNKFPTSDLDVIVYWNGAYDYSGATLNAPERLVLLGPTGTMYLLIDGYEINTGREVFELRITFV